MGCQQKYKIRRIVAEYASKGKPWNCAKSPSFVRESERTMEISILSIASLSALGTEQEAKLAYASSETALRQRQVGARQIWAGSLPRTLSEDIETSLSDAYKRLDPSVWYAIWTARAAYRQSGWQTTDFGLNVGSSRGATHLWETYFDQFSDSGTVATPASPTTTLGNIASWVAHDLGSQGPSLSHSITCSSALHAVLNGCAWLRSGLSKRFMAGGSEAPLTPFTFAQMEALKIYSREAEPYPSRPLDSNKSGNTFVLGEGAAMVCLEAGRLQDALAVIAGIGFGTETLTHGASLTSDAKCLQRSMQMAISGTDINAIDAVVLHAPGTLKGDRAELAAIGLVFGEHTPALYSNKWKIGHTLGASGLLSVEMALQLLKGEPVAQPPYLHSSGPQGTIRRVLVNAVGFGGNAVSLLLERP